MKTLYYTTVNWKYSNLLIMLSEVGPSSILFLADRKADELLDRFAGKYSLIPTQNRYSAFLDKLSTYLNGEKVIFDETLDPIGGTPFQKQVWNSVSKIPYGETRTYGEIAKSLGRPKASRAVGAANGANPLPIVVPCHRVIQSNGHLGGYGGGIAIKDALLRMEHSVL